MLAVLDGSCRTPVGALSAIVGDVLTLKGEILSLDGQTAFIETVSGPVRTPKRWARRWASKLLDRAGTQWLAQWAQT